MQWNTGKLSKEEEKNLAMATEELKDMLQYGHLELADETMDPGCIQHDPNVPPRPRRLQAVHEPRPRPDTTRDQGGMGECAFTDSDRQARSWVMMWDRTARFPTMQVANTGGTTSTSSGSRT